LVKSGHDNEFANIQNPTSKIQPFGAASSGSGAIVLEDPRIRGVNRDNLALIFRQHYWYPTADTNVYRPLVTLSFLLNYAVLGNGEDPQRTRRRHLAPSPR
jgi:hypothetical protein